MKLAFRNKSIAGDGRAVIDMTGGEIDPEITLGRSPERSEAVGETGGGVIRCGGGVGVSVRFSGV